MTVYPSWARAWPYRYMSTLPSENLKPAMVMVPLLPVPELVLPQAAATITSTIARAARALRSLQFIEFLSP